jgi:putative FmdB family regulatory protein
LPLYEYSCTACGYSFEKIQKYSDDAETECPKCQGTLIRPVTAPALRFEGAGWYVNDYAGKGGAKAGEASASGENSADTSSASPAKESKTDAKPASTESASTAPTAPAAPAAGTSSSSTSTAG